MAICQSSVSEYVSQRFLLSVLWCLVSLVLLFFTIAFHPVIFFCGFLYNIYSVYWGDEANYEGNRKWKELNAVNYTFFIRTSRNFPNNRYSKEHWSLVFPLVFSLSFFKHQHISSSPKNNIHVFFIRTKSIL